MIEMSQVEFARRWAKQNPITDIEKITVEQLKKRLEEASKMDKAMFSDTRTFRVFMVVIYPENTEYSFAKQVLTDKKRSNSLAHWFPVYELDLSKAEKNE